MNPDFHITRRAPNKNKKCVKKSASKMLIAEIGKRIGKYDLINNSAQAQAGITFGHIARGDIESAMNELLKILPDKLARTIVNFAGRDEVHGVSMSQYQLVRVQVYSKSTMALFDSGAIPNVMSDQMVKKLHLPMQHTNRSIKVTNCALENA